MHQDNSESCKTFDNTNMDSFNNDKSKEKDIDEYSSSAPQSINQNNNNFIQNNDEERQFKNINLIKEIKHLNLERLDYYDIFKCGMRIRYNSNTYFEQVKNKSLIPIENMKEATVYGAGNCFYKCLSKFLYCKVEFDENLRRGILTICQDNIYEINNYQNKVKIQNDEIIDTIDYINNMDKNINWASEIDIIITCFSFEMNIAIYKYSDDKNNLEYINSFIYDANISNNPTMILINENNHYNLIYPYIYNSGTHIINEKNQFNDNDEINPYPRYLGKDKNLYFNIFKFLNDGIVNGKRTWPDYIEFIQDRKFRNKKKSEFYRKIGVTNECNVEHNLDFKKKICRYDNLDLIASQDKYIVENKRLYLTRYEYNNTTEKKLIFKKYLIPYQKEIANILYKNHDENNHPGRDETIESIKNNNYYWVTINIDVEEYLNNCIICGSKNNEKTKDEKLEEEENEEKGE